jgi:hypothetical protein
LPLGAVALAWVLPRATNESSESAKKTESGSWCQQSCSLWKMSRNGMSSHRVSGTGTSTAKLGGWDRERTLKFVPQTSPEPLRKASGRVSAALAIRCHPVGYWNSLQGSNLTNLSGKQHIAPATQAVQRNCICLTLQRKVDSVYLRLTPWVLKPVLGSCGRNALVRSTHPRSCWINDWQAVYSNHMTYKLQCHTTKFNGPMARRHVQRYWGAVATSTTSFALLIIIWPISLGSDTPWFPGWWWWRLSPICRLPAPRLGTSNPR